MPNYSTSYRFELPLTGERSGTWGDMMNTFMGTLLEDALSGGSSIVIPTDANYTLVTASGASDETRRLILNVTSGVSLSATRDIIIPSVRKVYSVLNSTTGGQSIRIRTSSSTTIVTIPNGRRRFVFCDGTNTFDMMSDLPSGATADGVQLVTLSASQSLSNKTLTSPVITTPTITVRDDVLTIQDNLDNTKQARLELSSISPGQTRIVTLPDANITLVGTDTTQTLTNKTLTSPVLTTPTITVRDNVFTLQDNADATKQALFELNGITTGNTRTIAVSDGSFNIGGVPVIGTSANYNITAADRGDMIACYAGCSTVTFPNAAATGVANNFFCKVFNNTGGNVTINATAPSVFVLAGTGYPASFTLPHLSQCTVISDGTNWWVDAPIPYDNSVITGKIANAAVTPAKLSQPLTSAGVQSMTGVTSREWTGIPSWVRKVTISFADVTLASGNISVRLGTSGGYITTNSYFWDSTNLSGWAGSSPRTAFTLATTNANSDYSGHFVLTNHQDSNTWVASALFVIPNVGPFQVTGAGYISLGTLDRIQVLQLGGGATTFASGSVSVLYE